MKGIKKIIATMLFLAIFKMPYSYYEILRVVVALGSWVSASDAYNKKSSDMGLVFIICLILWNPIIPIHLPKEVWIPLDLIAAAFFVNSAANENKNE